MTVFVHVGYPKTASTWLQTRVFPGHAGLDQWRQVPGFDWVDGIVDRHDFDFDAKAHLRLYTAPKVSHPLAFQRTLECQTYSGKNVSVYGTGGCPPLWSER